MYKGSCLCGVVTFELDAEPKAVSHCHCKMCQKQHGAAFATYASIPKKQFTYITGESNLTTYNSSESIRRKFCSSCGSNIEWCGSKKYPEWVSFAIATLDAPFNPKAIKEIHTESKACWLANG